MLETLERFFTSFGVDSLSEYSRSLWTASFSFGHSILASIVVSLSTWTRLKFYLQSYSPSSVPFEMALSRLLKHTQIKV